MKQEACRLTSTSPEVTREIGAMLGRALLVGDVVGLIGDLGAGKTVLVQGMARGLDAATEATSPTFVLMHVYTGRIRLLHADLYRLPVTQAAELGFDDYLLDAAGVIEWAERLAGLEPDLVARFSSVPAAPEMRHIEFSARSARGDALLQALSPLSS